MNNKLSSVIATALLVWALVLASEAPAAEAVTCNPVQMASCLSAILNGSPPSATCCANIREQRPCLCGYLKNPSLRQYVNSPNARKVASTCGVPYPNNC